MLQAIRPNVAADARVAEVDILRGLVIVLMALDHVRDYFHAGFGINPLDPAQTTPLLYATRWITHCCAPTFVFLSGVSAWLQFARGKTTPKLSRFLFTRGLWLILLELTVVNFGWAFGFSYPLLMVIWAIGCSMIALSALVWLPRTAVLAIGIAIIAAHNLLDPITPDQLGSAELLWTFLHEGGPIFMDGKPIGVVVYPILPWIGVMALGYGVGTLFAKPTQERDRLLITLGLGMVVAFLVLRGLSHYGDPRPWIPQSDWIANGMVFLNVTKYPPSLMFVLITLGLMLTLLPALRHLSGTPKTVLLTFGAVPFFFYILHLYLIHALSIVANAVAGHNVEGLFNWVTNAFTAPDKLRGLGFSLPIVYLAWIAALAMLYPLCRWWADVKRRRRDWWLSYL